VPGGIGDAFVTRFESVGALLNETRVLVPFPVPVAEYVPVESKAHSRASSCACAAAPGDSPKP